MAKFSPDPVASGPAIRGISGGGFRIDDQLYPDGALLTPEAATAWTAPAIEALDLAALSPIDDVRATAAYRRDAALTLMRRAIDACVRGETGGVV